MRRVYDRFGKVAARANEREIARDACVEAVEILSRLAPDSRVRGIQS